MTAKAHNRVRIPTWTLPAKDREALRSMVDFLREHFPQHATNDDIRVRLTTRLGFANGRYTYDSDGGHTILVGTRPPSDRALYGMLTDTLVHEWAHAIVPDSGPEHSDDWGIAYATIYRALEAWDAGLLD